MYSIECCTLQLRIRVLRRLCVLLRACSVRLADPVPHRQFILHPFCIRGRLRRSTTCVVVVVVYSSLRRIPALRASHIEILLIRIITVTDWAQIHPIGINISSSSSSRMKSNAHGAWCWYEWEEERAIKRACEDLDRGMWRRGPD